MTNTALRFKSFRAQFRHHQPFLLVLIVFLTFRLLLPFVFRNGSYFVEQAPDIGDYMRWGTLADSHLYPFVHYWSEYPPLFAWSIIGLYRLSLLLPAWSDQRLWFSIIMQLAMTLFDLGSVMVVYAIALRFSSRLRATRAAALFATSFILAYGASGWYEPVPLFFLLLTLYLTLRERYVWSAVTAVVGLLTKIVPILIVPIVLQRIAGWRRRAGYLALVIALSIGLLLPFMITGGEYMIAFVRATLNRPSWLSIWALLDGNTTFGASVPLIDRFSPQNVGVTPTSALPLPLITLAFAILFLFLYTRRGINWQDARQSTAFAGITVILFLLWSKGFSGQFTVYVLPFVALLLPNWRGVLYLVLLSILWVAEWPLAFTALENQNWVIVWIVLVRTAVLVALCIEYAACLFPRVGRTARYTGNAVLVLGLLSVVPVSIFAVNTYTSSTLQADAALPGLEVIRAQNHDRTVPIAFGQTRLFRRLYPAARDLGEPTLLPIFKHTPEGARLDWLRSIGSGGAFWFITDQGDPTTADENRQAETWMTEHACRVDSNNAGSARVSRFIVPQNATGASQASGAVFGDEIALDSFQVSQSSLKPGEGLCVELKWQALKQPSADDTVFIHVLNAAGQLVAQNDMPPQSGFAPTSHWQAGGTIDDRHGVILPANLPAGEYAIQVGLYRSDDQSPVSPGAVDLAKITVAP